MKISPCTAWKEKFESYTRNVNHFFRFPFKSDNSYWIKLEFENRLSPATKKLLEVGYTDFDEVHAYDNGISLPLKHYRTYAFELNFQENEHKNIFLHIISHTGPAVFDLNLYDENTYLAKQFEFGIIYGIYLGVIFIALLYASITIFFMRSRIYMIYVFHLLGIALFVFLQSGFGHFYFESQSFIRELFITSGLIYMLTFGLFVFFVLSDALTASMKKVYYTLFFTGIAGYILHLFADYPPTLISLSTIGIDLFSLFCGYYAFRRNHSGGVYVMLIAAVTTLGSLVFISGMLFQIIPLTQFITEIMGFTSIIEILIVLVMFIVYFKKTMQLKERFLEEKIQAEQEKQEKEKMLFMQNRMATMGEMLGIIVHQWKQPLNAINILADNIREIIIYEDGNHDALMEINSKINKQVDHMSDTMDDFRKFFKPSQNSTCFNACEIAQNVYELIEPKMKYLDIHFTIHPHECFEVQGYPNELKQVLLNIYNNACDVFDERKPKDWNIDLYFEKQDTTALIRIQDTGGGIPQELLPDKIFESYVSTKGDKRTDIGMEISKTIMEKKFHGKIKAQNSSEGAEFILEFPI